MNKFLKYIGIIIGIIILAGVGAYFAWFHNPHQHILTLDPTEVYASDKGVGYLITNANIIDVEMGVVHENRHILVQNGTLDRIFEGPIPDSLIANYTVIDAENRYLMPGMIDMHAHLNSGGLIPPDASVRTVSLEQFARYGVTLIFTLGGHGFNQEITRDLIRKQQNREIVAPIIFATGDILTTTGGYPIGLLPMMLGTPVDKINLDEVGIQIVNEDTDLDAIFLTKTEMGMKGIKVMVESGLGGGPEEPRLSTDMVRKIAQKATEYGLLMFAHVSRQGDFEDAINAGVDVLVHTVGDQVLTNAESLFEKMREDSIYCTPTLSIAYMHQYVASAEILDDPFMMQYSSERTNRSLRNWPIRQLMVKGAGIDPAILQKNMLQNFSLLYAAGVPILMGSDAGNPSVIPGYSAHKELEFMAQGGMSNADVLRSATISPARFLGLNDTMGSIAEGKMASFLMLDRNPLEDVRNTRSIIRVMLEGYWIE
jgi:imidazolonepropionase-like amidohydrolase